MVYAQLSHDQLPLNGLLLFFIWSKKYWFVSREEMSDSQNSRKLYHLLLPQKHINDQQNFAVVTQIMN